MEGQKRGRSLLPLVLLTLFSAAVLAVLLSAADAGRRLADRDEAAFDRRTALQYVAARVRSAGAEITVEDFAGPDSTLCIREELEGETYLTRLYCHGGALRELFCGAEEEMAPENGEIIVAAEEMRFVRSGSRICVLSRDAGGRSTCLTLALRVEQEGAA